MLNKLYIPAESVYAVTDSKQVSSRANVIYCRTALIEGPRCAWRTERAMACKAPRQRWQSRQRWQYRICNLQNLKEFVGFESHPLRQNKPLSINLLRSQCFLMYLFGT